jgi:hypothetical protein|tara:strand:+ start:204 stop:431 length:228 start_codon:yes stop_codon:yes gene_type:complete
MKYAKVEGHSHLLRDSKTNSIINTNMVEYQEYLNRRNVKVDENQKIQHLESDVANIKNDLSEIKSLLRSLVNESR